MTVALPFSPVPGADKPGSLAEATQANLDALAQAAAPNRAFSIFGQFSLPFTLAAGTGTAISGAAGFDAAQYPTWVPVGAVNYTGAVAGQNRVTWAYRPSGVTATPVEIALFNAHTASVSGTFYFYILAA